MDDLISRKALLEELDKWINPCVNYDKSEFLSGITTAISEVETAPEVDAALVVRGEWIELHEENGHEVGTCSHCRHVRIVDNYCPNCGAKMDGGHDNTDLKPCPFCGGKAEFVRKQVKTKGHWCDAVYVHCTNCDARSNRVLYSAKYHKNDSEYLEAQEAWNRRADNGKAD